MECALDHHNNRLKRLASYAGKKSGEEINGDL